MRPLLLFAVTAIFLIAAEKPKKDSDAIRGKWKVVAAERNGKPQENQVGVTMEFGDTIKIVLKNGLKQEGKWQIDPSAKPKQLDLTLAVAEEGKKTGLGIYELTDDELIICFANPETARPKEFKSGEQVTLLKLEREKP